jgi:hypothetical protein
MVLLSSLAIFPSHCQSSDPILYKRLRDEEINSRSFHILCVAQIFIGARCNIINVCAVFISHHSNYTIGKQ